MQPLPSGPGFARTARHFLPTDRSFYGSLALLLRIGRPPGIAETTLSVLKTFCKVGPEFEIPLPDRFVGNNDAAFGEQIFYVTEAHTETMIDPDSIADDFRREAASAEAGAGALHERSLSVRRLT